MHYVERLQAKHLAGLAIAGQEKLSGAFDFQDYTGDTVSVGCLEDSHGAAASLSVGAAAGARGSFLRRRVRVAR